MKKMDAKELSRAFGFADAAVGELVKCHLDAGRTVREIKPEIDAIFAPKPFDGPWGQPMRTLRTAIEQAPLFDTFEALTRHLQEVTDLEGENFDIPLRLLLTGAEEGPDLSSLYPHLKSYLQEIVQ